MKPLATDALRSHGIYDHGRSMDIRADQGKAEKYPCEILLLFTFDSPEEWEGSIRAVDSKWKGFLSNLMKQGDFKGELYECQLLYTRGLSPPEGS